jgi:aspartyl-tRNA(Asn)/glutamyl-tRNA(Gln) amidotransferase subunit C
MFNADDIKKLARLAHLEVTPEQASQLIPKLSAIVEHISQLKEVDVSGVEAMSHVHGSTNVFRTDEVRPHLSIDALMQNAPDRSGRFIRVPLIVE